MALNKYCHPLNLSSNDRQPTKQNGFKPTMEDSDSDYDISIHKGQISVNSSPYDFALHKSMAQTEKTRRSARARKPMSYHIPPYNPDDEVEASDDHSLRGKPISKNPPPKPINEPPIKRLRMRISRDHPVPPPPPLPTIPSRYMQGDCIPPWLMNTTIVKSSNLRIPSSQNSTSNQHPHDGPGSHQLSSPTRPTSPSKMVSTQRSSQSHPAFVGSSSTTSSEERERERERYWARYDYNYSSPHLQSRYYGSSPPSSERWADLDTQNPSAIPMSTPTSFVQPLFDVFASSESKASDSEALALASRLEKSVSFGYEVGLQVYASHL